MIRALFKFIFSPPPHPTARPSVRVPSETVEEAPRDVATTEPAVLNSFVARLIAFTGVALVSFVILAPTMRFASPRLLPEVDPAAQHVLRPAAWVFGLCAVPLALVIGVALSGWIAGAIRGVNPGRPPLLWVLASMLMLGVATIPYFTVLHSSVQFTPEAVKISPLVGFGETSHGYSDVKALRTSLAGPAGGWLPGNDRFVFAIDFSDGTTWRSLWYPCETDSVKDSELIRFLHRKTGKYSSSSPNI